MVKYILQDHIFLQKAYIDKPESVDKNGEAITGDHTRLKSVPTSCINHTSRIMEMQPMDIYKHLYGDGNHIQFDLIADGKNCGFKYEKDMSV